MVVHTLEQMQLGEAKSEREGQQLDLQNREAGVGVGWAEVRGGKMPQNHPGAGDLDACWKAKHLTLTELGVNGRKAYSHHLPAPRQGFKGTQEAKEKQHLLMKHSFV